MFYGSHVAVKLNFGPFIQLYTSPNENFEYSYPLIKILWWNKKKMADADV